MKPSPVVPPQFEDCLNCMDGVDPYSDGETCPYCDGLSRWRIFFAKGERVVLLPHPQMWPKEMDGLEGVITGHIKINGRIAYTVKIDCLARELHCDHSIIGKMSSGQVD